MLAADPAARRHLAATSRWSRRLRWEAAAPAIRTGSGPAPSGEAGLLTVTGWRSPGQLAALRDQLSAWPMSLSSTAARLILAVGPEHDVVILQTHHAAFDGISGLALLAAICAAYRDRAGPGIRPQSASPSCPASDPAPPAWPRTGPGTSRHRRPGADGRAARPAPAARRGHAGSPRRQHNPIGPDTVSC